MKVHVTFEHQIFVHQQLICAKFVHQILNAQTVNPDQPTGSHCVVAMTHFVVARGGPPVATTKRVFTGKSIGIRSIIA